MPARIVRAFVVCTGVCFAGAQVMQAQEATSANLPDQFQTGEMIQIHKPKKKKAERLRKRSQRPQSKTLHLYPSRRRLQKKYQHRSPQQKRKRQSPIGACLDATKSKTGDPQSNSRLLRKAGSSRRACRKETSTEKTATTCCATGGGEHFGARSGVAFGGTIHGNHRAFA